MTSRKIGLTAAGLVAAGALGLGGAALATAETSPTPSTSATSGAPAANGGSGGGMHTHTPVTGTELAKVAAAVERKDPAYAVTSVEKDPDGSYDVHATRSGTTVRLEVSADLATVTEGGQGGPGGHDGRGPGGASQDTPVTGAERTKVEAAVTAKDSALTVTEVRRDPDGSYDVLGTKSGTPTMFEVSKDLSTVTERTAGPGGPGAGGPGTGTTQADASAANGTA